jgi:hypothetical protein
VRTTLAEKATVVERGKMRKGGIALALRTISHFVDSPDELSNHLMEFFMKIYQLNQVN